MGLTMDYLLLFFDQHWSNNVASHNGLSGCVNFFCWFKMVGTSILRTWLQFSGKNMWVISGQSVKVLISQCIVCSLVRSAQSYLRHTGELSINTEEHWSLFRTVGVMFLSVKLWVVFFHWFQWIANQNIRQWFYVASGARTTASFSLPMPLRLVPKHNIRVATSTQICSTVTLHLFQPRTEFPTYLPWIPFQFSNMERTTVSCWWPPGDLLPSQWLQINVPRCMFSVTTTGMSNLQAKCVAQDRFMSLMNAMGLAPHAGLGPQILSFPYVLDSVSQAPAVYHLQGPLWPVWDMSYMWRLLQPVLGPWLAGVCTRCGAVPDWVLDLACRGPPHAGSNTCSSQSGMCCMWCSSGTHMWHTPDLLKWVP